MLAELPSTYGRGKEFVAGSAKVVANPVEGFDVVVTLADGTAHIVYDRNTEPRARLKADDLNTIE
jgi:hypothetical protein